MQSFIVLLAIVASLFAATNAFSPTNTVNRVTVRGSTVVMDGKTRVLRDRIKSVKNTRRITEAMRLVAAARVRRAQEAVLKSRPLVARLQGLYKDLLAAVKQEDLELPILEVRDVKKVSLVVITGDRGLCGSYNSAVIKATTRRIARLKEQGIEVELVLVGRKGQQWWAKKGLPIGGTFPLGNNPSPEVGARLSNFLIARFLSKRVDAAEVIYTRFNNLISSEPSIRTLLPLSLTGIESENDEIFMMTSEDGKLTLKRAEKEEEAPFGSVDAIFEEEPSEILKTVLQLYFGSTVMRCMQESVASELASRMTAMQSASNNAKKITTVLSQVYNRARQASVTQEMLEIVAGASSMTEGKE